MNEDIFNPQYRDLSEMYIDLGIRGKEKVEALGIRPGDTVTPLVTFKEMADPDVMMAKAGMTALALTSLPM